MRKKIIGGAAVAFAAGAAIMALPGTASAAWAHNLGNHTVCADTLTFHSTDGSPNFPMARGGVMYIYEYRDGGNRAMVTIQHQDSSNRGWVYNGYFC